MPYPSYSFSRKTPIHLYFEISNLLLNSSGLTSYEVGYELHTVKSGLIQRLAPGQKLSLASSYDQEGNQRSAQEYFALSFESVKSGDYALIVRVTDKIARLTETSEIRLRVTDQE